MKYKLRIYFSNCGRKLPAILSTPPEPHQTDLSIINCETRHREVWLCFRISSRSDKFEVELHVRLKMHEKSEQPGNCVSNCKLPIDETTSMILEFYGGCRKFYTWARFRCILCYFSRLRSETFIALAIKTYDLGQPGQSVGRLVAGSKLSCCSVNCFWWLNHTNQHGSDVLRLRRV